MFAEAEVLAAEKAVKRAKLLLERAVCRTEKMEAVFDTVDRRDFKRMFQKLRSSTAAKFDEMYAQSDLLREQLVHKDAQLALVSLQHEQTLEYVQELLG